MEREKGQDKEREHDKGKLGHTFAVPFMVVCLLSLALPLPFADEVTGSSSPSKWSAKNGFFHSVKFLSR